MTTKSKMTTGMMVVFNGRVHAEAYDVSEPDFSVEDVDSTTHDDGGHKSNIPGQSSDGKLVYKVNFVNDAAQAALRVAARAKTTGLWQIVYPASFGSLGYEVQGYVSNLKKVTPMKSNPATWEITITPSSTVTERTTAAAGLTTPWVSVTNQAAEALTLAPVAAAAERSYAVESYRDDTGIKITPTASVGTIYVDGTIVASGAASGACTIDTVTGHATDVFIVVTEALKIPQITKIRATTGLTQSPA